MFLTVYETSNFPHFYLHRMIFECLFPTKSEKKITNIANRILFNFNFQQETNVREILQKLPPKETVYSSESSKSFTLRMFFVSVGVCCLCCCCCGYYVDTYLACVKGKHAFRRISYLTWLDIAPIYSKGKVFALVW